MVFRSASPAVEPSEIGHWSRIFSCMQSYGCTMERRDSLPHEMRNVAIVLIADVFRDFPPRRKLRRFVHLPRPGISSGIVDGDLHVDPAQLGARVAFDDVSL